MYFGFIMWNEIFNICVVGYWDICGYVLLIFFFFESVFYDIILVFFFNKFYFVLEFVVLMFGFGIFWCDCVWFDNFVFCDDEIVFCFLVFVVF